MITDDYEPLDDGVVRLREITPADATQLYRWRTDPRSRDSFRTTEIGPFEDHLQFVEGYFDAANRDEWFVIEAEEEPVGTIALYGFSGDGQSAEWGRLIVDPDRRGRGYASRALALLLDRCRALGLRRVFCEILETNAVTRRLHRQRGFQRVARRAYDGRDYVVLEYDFKQERT